MAQLSKPAIPAKMYRNFAVATVGVTALLAITAQGPNEPEETTPAATAEVNPVPTGSPTPRYGQAELRHGNTVERGEGYTNYQEFGGSTLRGGANNSAVFVTASDPVAGSENAGFTREYLDSLSEEELAELLRQLQAAGIDDPAKRRQALAVLEAGSRRRSGRGTAVE